MSSRRNALLVFKTDLFNDSDNDEQLFGFHGEDVVLREAAADSDFDVNEVSHEEYSREPQAITLLLLITSSLPFTLALSIHGRMWSSISAFNCCPSTAILL